MKHIAVIFIVIIGSLSACNARQPSREYHDVDRESGQKVLVRPPVPAGADTVTFSATHYWDNADFRDTAFIADEEFVKREFSQFVTLLQLMDNRAGQRDIMGSLARRAACCPQAFSTFLITAREVLYDSESPTRDEELLAYFLEAGMALDNVEPTDSDMMGYLSANVNNNRAGSRVAPLDLVDHDGSTVTLSHVLNGSPLSIVMFYDPDCGSCDAIHGQLDSAPQIARLVNAGELQLVAVDAVSAGSGTSIPGGKFTSPWHVYASRDDMMESTAFLLSSIPSLFLIDSSGTVILKVPTINTLVNYLSANVPALKDSI